MIACIVVVVLILGLSLGLWSVNASGSGDEVTHGNVENDATSNVDETLDDVTGPIDGIH